MNRTAVAAAFLFSLASQEASAATAYYSVAGGAQFQIGSERPMPLQPVPTTGGTWMKQVVTKTVFPKLLIPVDPDPAKALVQQTAGPDPKQITIPPGVLHRPAPGPMTLGLAKFNPRLLQVRTNIDFSAPAAKSGPAVLRAGGRTGPPIATYPGPIQGDVVRYVKTAAQFGGPLQTRIAPASPVRVWGHLGAMLPCKHPFFLGSDLSCQATLFQEDPGTLVAAGAKVGFTLTSAAAPAMSPNRVFASIPNTNGTIAKSASAFKSGTLTNMLTSAGFPWTTGRLHVSEISALGDDEQFTITGMDSRVNGIGTISLVSGALTERPFSGPNGNRGWLRLTVPEPGAVFGALTAFAALALCHGFARRRQ
jgi:hypothetical protein